MIKYLNEDRFVQAVDCIILGFDGDTFKVLLIQRAFEPEKGKWSLMGGFVKQDEDLDQASKRILQQTTGLKGTYLEQLHTFGKRHRDPVERTISTTYFALIDIQKYEKQISDAYHAEWFDLKHLPELIFDHREMIDLAQKRVRYKAALHPILFELLPGKFTIPELKALYEGVYQHKFDNRNFNRKLLSTGLLIKMDEKQKTSKKGAFYYKLDQSFYNKNLESFLNLVPNPDKFF